MRQSAVIRFLVVALPLGLFCLIVFSLVRFQLRLKDSVPIDEFEGKRIEAAGLMQKDINREDLEEFLTMLSVTIGERHVGKYESLEKTAFWLESMLGGGNFGYQIERQEYEVEGRKVRNLIASLPGTSRREEIVVIGAHYDSVPGCPAANDNGSGVAALLALAQAFAGAQQERTIRFVAFVNEEPPYFHTEQMGSRVYARSCQDRNEDIKAMISLETIGYFSDQEGSQRIPEGLDGSFPSKGNFLAFVANAESRFIADSARASFVSASGIPALAGAFSSEIPGVDASDHWSFWKSGFPAVMVTDTAPYRYPYYHTKDDTIDKIDFETLEKVCQGLKGVVKTWANPG